MGTESAGISCTAEGGSRPKATVRKIQISLWPGTCTEHQLGKPGRRRQSPEQHPPRRRHPSGQLRPQAAPDVRFWPAILRFLGCDPRPEPEGFGGRLKRAREDEGLTERDLARQLGLDSSTVSAWERDEIRHPYPRIRRVFEHWLAAMEVKRPA
jgi:ribosome-binding protein aMBF1 (putative translation factor)